MAHRYGRKAPQAVADFTKLHYQRGKRPARFDIFKHFILSRVFHLFNEQQSSAWTYVDFSAGSGKIPVAGKSEALQIVYKQAREDHDNRKLNCVLPLIQCINKLNGVTGRKEQLTPPKLGEEPEFYPTGAGFADMFLRPQDRAILIEPDKDEFEKLQENLGGDKRFKLYCDKISQNMFNAHLPPINRKGVVFIDVHKGVQDIIEKNLRNDTKLTNPMIEGNLDYMAGLIGNSCKAWPNATYIIPYGNAMLHHSEKLGDRPRNEEVDSRVLAKSEIPVPPAKFLTTIKNSGVKQMLITDMYMEDEGEGIACLIINPPQGLDHELYELLPDVKEMLSNPTKKKAWRRPRVVWPNRSNNYFDKEAQARKKQWTFIPRTGLNDEEIAQYEKEVASKNSKDGEFFDDYMNYDEHKEWAELGHENVDLETMPTGKGNKSAKDRLISSVKATKLGQTGGVVYPFKAKKTAE